TELVALCSVINMHLARKGADSDYGIVRVTAVLHPNKARISADAHFARRSGNSQILVAGNILKEKRPIAKFKPAIVLQTQRTPGSHTHQPGFIIKLNAPTRASVLNFVRLKCVAPAKRYRSIVIRVVA